MPNLETAQQNTSMPLQNNRKTCITQQKRNIFISVVFFLVILLGFGLVTVSVHLGSNFIKHPDFDENAVEGRPEVDEKYAYSHLEVEKGYAVDICGLVANDGQNLQFFLTNPKNNEVWIRAQVLDSEGNLLGETGVLKQGEYLPEITLSKPLQERETPVVVKVISYEPNKWYSRGNLSLNVTIYRDFV